MKQYGRKREKPHLVTVAAARPLLSATPVTSTLPATQALKTKLHPPLRPLHRLPQLDSSQSSSMRKSRMETLAAATSLLIPPHFAL
jgi:hypothetical protein